MTVTCASMPAREDHMPLCSYFEMAVVQMRLGGLCVWGAGGTSLFLSFCEVATDLARGASTPYH